MASYIGLMKMTEAGVKSVKELPARVEANVKRFKEKGIEIKSWHMTMGRYDVVVVFDAPNDEAATQAALAIGGQAQWGHEAQIGYMPQDVRPIIPNNTTCFDYLHDIDPSAGNEEIRGLLGRMLFRGDEGMKPTKALSGGEAVRLLFCKLMLVKPNILVLDEPTNHLDLEAISALGEGLQNYPGTVIFVAHDRDLIDTAATRILAFTHGGLEDFAGDYETFLEKHGGFIDAR